MINVDVINKRKTKTHAIQALGVEKHERVARQSLQDMKVFHRSLTSEMQKMLAAKASGKDCDNDLLERMSIVDIHYGRVMDGFLNFNDHEQRHALMVFADAVQDLMKYIHTRRNI